MPYKIQYFNWDEKNEWQDAGFAGMFDTEEEAQRRLDELYSEWPSRFKKGRVVPTEEVMPK